MEAASEVAAGVQPERKDWFGQPRGLTILFLTEMWEMFSYYGMRALLVYYMVKQLAITQQRASLVYGMYTAFVYFTPIVGGIVCDRWLGRRNSVLLGGSIMAIGHFMMAFEPLFFVALATIGIGNGLFLPSLPSQINGLYRPDDPRRSTAYNYYYLGVNVGAFLAPLGCGTVGELYGWHWGFTLAGIGMIGGLLIYIFGSRYLPPEPLRVATAQPVVRQQLVRGRNRATVRAARGHLRRGRRVSRRVRADRQHVAAVDRERRPLGRRVHDPDDLVPVAQPAAGLPADAVVRRTLGATRARRP